MSISKSRNTIAFNSKNNNKYSFLSNFYPSKIIINDKEYYHVEGYYQSCKYKGVNNELAEQIRLAVSPGKCKQLAYTSSMSQEREQQWNLGLKIKVMKSALFIKFTTSIELKELLLSTENSTLIEHALWDSYWGGGPTGKGQNMLGKLLMEIRETLIL